MHSSMAASTSGVPQHFYLSGQVCVTNRESPVHPVSHHRRACKRVRIYKCCISAQLTKLKSMPQVSATLVCCSSLMMSLAQKNTSLMNNKRSASHSLGFPPLPCKGAAGKADKVSVIPRASTMSVRCSGSMVFLAPFVTSKWIARVLPPSFVLHRAEAPGLR